MNVYDVRGSYAFTITVVTRNHWNRLWLPRDTKSPKKMYVCHHDKSSKIPPNSTILFCTVLVCQAKFEDDLIRSSSSRDRVKKVLFWPFFEYIFVLAGSGTDYESYGSLLSNKNEFIKIGSQHRKLGSTVLMRNNQLSRLVVNMVFFLLIFQVNYDRF